MAPSRSGHIAGSSIAQILALIAVVAFGASGLMKAVDVYEFSRLLRLWAVIPRSLTPVLAVLIPMIEVGLATAWLSNFGRRAASFGIVGVLCLFSVAATWQYVAYEPVQCGCFGGDSLQGADMGDLAILLTRNIAMLVALTLFLALGRRAPMTPDRSRTGAMA